MTCGELRSHQPADTHQPSQLGGERALAADSSAADAEQLKHHARNRSGDGQLHRVVERFRPGRYHSMADIGREIGRAMRAG